MISLYQNEMIQGHLAMVPEPDAQQVLSGIGQVDGRFGRQRIGGSQVIYNEPVGSLNSPGMVFAREEDDPQQDD